jgi:YVTN family beta-propeller protein
MKVRVLLICLSVSLLFSCKKDEPETPIVVPEETVGFYVCCEGLFNQNNGSLFYYDVETGQAHRNYFETQNQRGLGDLPNDLKIYGSKMYCVVNGSNTLEVMNAATGVSLRQIRLTNDDGVGRQPRYIAFHQNKGYVCNFDGTVVRIDTSSLAIEAIMDCGKNPDGICVANNKLYVSNSGGLDFPNFDNTVSVIDIESFTEIKRITVGVNPGKIFSDSEGDVYLISRGDYGGVPPVFQRIDSRTDAVQTFDNINPTNFTLCNDIAYLYHYDYVSGSSWFKSFDCKTEQTISESFITDGTAINTPYGIDVNPLTGDVYITDAYNFSMQGDLYCFDKEGKQRFKIAEVGLNPNVTVTLTSFADKSLRR